MYSNSNSYLGGGNNLRPGPQQYGGSFGMGGQQPGQQQQQPSPFAPQPTGFGQAPLQQQYTGYPGVQPQPTGLQAPGQGQLQPQFTGYGQPPPQQNFSAAAPAMPAIPQQYQQQFQQQQQQQQQQPPNAFGSALPQPSAQTAALPPAAPVQKPQPTGFSEMAASFQTGGTAKPKGRREAKPVTKIPNIRLSFITAQDQARFETLFKSAVGDGQTTMSGEKARDLLMRSRLDGESLSQIWYVSCVSVHTPKLTPANPARTGLWRIPPGLASFTFPNFLWPCISAT